MSERAPITPPTPERSPREQDPAAPLVDAMRELHFATYINPNNLDDPNSSDSHDDVWDPFDAEDGIDGLYELDQHISEIRQQGDPSRTLRPYEQKAIALLYNEAEVNRAQSHVDMAKLDAPIDGVENPRHERIHQIVAQLLIDQAHIDPADTESLAANKDKIRTLVRYDMTSKTPDTGTELRDFLNSHIMMESPHDESKDEEFHGAIAAADKKLNELAERNSLRTKAYTILADYYPADPLDAIDMPDDPRLEYVAATPNIPVDDMPTVPIDTVLRAPEALAQPSMDEESKAHEAFDREIDANELENARARMAEASRGIFGAPSPELESEYKEYVAAAGELWMQGELKRRGITQPTIRQETFLAAQFAAEELNKLTMAKKAADEKTLGTKFVNLVSEHPALASAAAAGLLLASGIGVPAVIMGTAGLLIYAKVRKKTRGIRNANQFLVASDLRDDIILGTVNPETGYDRSELFNAALNHTSDAFASEQRRERAKAVGVPAELERFVSRYARRLGGAALNGAGATNPARQSAYALAA